MNLLFDQPTDCHIYVCYETNSSVSFLFVLKGIETEIKRIVIVIVIMIIKAWLITEKAGTNDLVM